jgi:hypothetical protein
MWLQSFLSICERNPCSISELMRLVTNYQGLCDNWVLRLTHEHNPIKKEEIDEKAFNVLNSIYYFANTVDNKKDIEDGTSEESRIVQKAGIVYEDNSVDELLQIFLNRDGKRDKLLVILIKASTFFNDSKTYKRGRPTERHFMIATQAETFTIALCELQDAIDNDVEVGLNVKVMTDCNANDDGLSD